MYVHALPSINAVIYLISPETSSTQIFAIGGSVVCIFIIIILLHRRHKKIQKQRNQATQNGTPSQQSQQSQSAIVSVAVQSVSNPNGKTNNKEVKQATTQKSQQSHSKAAPPQIETSGVAIEKSKAPDSNGTNKQNEPRPETKAAQPKKESSAAVEKSKPPEPSDTYIQNATQSTASAAKNILGKTATAPQPSDEQMCQSQSDRASSSPSPPLPVIASGLPPRENSELFVPFQILSVAALAKLPPPPKYSDIYPGYVDTEDMMIYATEYLKNFALNSYYLENGYICNIEFL